MSPGIRDDIIIKGDVLDGLFRAARHEAKQVEKHGLLSECVDLDGTLRVSYEQFRDTLQATIDAMETMVTNKVVNFNASARKSNHAKVSRKAMPKRKR